MRLSFADASLAALDALTGLDAVALLVFEDERPLRSLAGIADWRLCGALSRILKEGRFTGARGDALLFPALSRFPGDRVFCFGAGRKAELGRAGFATAVRRMAQAISLAGAKAFVTELPEVDGLDEVERAKLFLTEGAAHFRGERIALCGDARGLARVFQQVSGLLPGLKLDREPPTVVAPPTPPRSPAKAARRA
jgi:hypothetical protein